VHRRKKVKRPYYALAVGAAYFVVIVLPPSLRARSKAKPPEAFPRFLELNRENGLRAKDFVIITIKTIRFTSHRPSLITLIKAP
jgi:hypothetical protein